MFSTLLHNAGGLMSVHKVADSHGPIGLDFGLHRLRMVQLIQRQDRLNLGACVSLPYQGDREQLLASPRRLAGLLRRLCKQQGFKGRDVVTCLQPDVVRMLLLHYTVAAGQSDAGGHVIVDADHVGAQACIDRLGTRGAEAAGSYVTVVVRHRSFLSHVPALAGHTSRATA